MTTEDDLRTALLEFADHNEPDHLAVRAEIEARLTAPSRSGHRADRRPLTTLISLAACVAVVIGVAVGFHLSRGHTNPASTITPTPVQSVYGVQLYPGTLLLATFQGSGSRTIVPPAWKPGPHDEVAYVVTCGGTGSLTVVGVFLEPSCSDSGGVASSLGSVPTLQISARPEVNWRVAQIEQPLPRTSGTLGYPDETFTQRGIGTDLGGASSRGNGTIHLTPAAATGHYTIWLKCSGDGVTISGAFTVVQHVYTQSCFAGWTYSWNIATGDEPTELKVTASPGTSWSVLVNPTS